MKTFHTFMEATTDDLRAMGASSDQIKEIERRKKKRGYGFDRGDDRAKTAPAAQKKKPTQKALPGSKGAPLARRAADKGSAIVRQKQKEKIGKGYMTDPDMEPGKVGGEGFGRRPEGHWGKGKKEDEKEKERKKRKWPAVKRPVIGGGKMAPSSGHVGQQAQTMQHTGGTKHF